MTNIYACPGFPWLSWLSLTGQAARLAASLAVGHAGDVRGFKIEDLQRKLIALGAYLPNAV